MIPFEETDLHVIELESENGEINRLYLLNEIVEEQPFNADEFVTKMEEILPQTDKNPELFDALLDEMNVIEIFDQSDIEELIDEGLIDPDDLHQSLYDFLAIENENDLFDENALDSI